jgi:hypothetical protein
MSRGLLEWNVQVISYPGATHSVSHPDGDALGKKFNLNVEKR